MIRRLLVANRGEIARRVMRSAQAMGISCVAVCSDADAGAPHTGEADLVVRLPGASSADTYLNVEAVVAAAQAAGADAVHPGYGFLSENAGFARACLQAGLTWVGPSPQVIEAMGSKLGAKASMAAAGVPVLPQVEVPGHLSRSAAGGPPAAADAGGGGGHQRSGGDGAGSAERTLQTVADQAAQLGWPVLVKASAGGGGRGMRVVERAEDLPQALAGAAREAASAFGDGTVFLEPYVARPRHVEVQILGDSHGNIVHLFERECSIQRRHQKIVEECPSPAVDDQLRARLGDAAVTAAATVGYVGAGTVEFLLLPDGSFAFLEMNTRLQVEHPVTECVTGLDLVRLQLLIADGQALPAEALRPVLQGHAIEVRLYAEDPTADWRPSAGCLARFRVPGDRFGGGWLGAPTGGGPRLRVDSGVEDGSEVSPFYDPMLAKVIGWAPTRDEAARVLAGGLVQAQVHGVTTNRDLLVRILLHEEFVAGDIDTGFLTRHDPAVLGAPLVDDAMERVHAAAAALAAQAARRVAAGPLGGPDPSARFASVEAGTPAGAARPGASAGPSAPPGGASGFRGAPAARFPSGWRNVPSEPQTVPYQGRSGPLPVSYRFDRHGGLAELSVAGQRLAAEVGIVGGELVELTVDGALRRLSVQRVPDPGGQVEEDTVGATVYVDGPDGGSVLREQPRFPLPGSQLAPGSLVAPLPGTVVGIAVSVGSAVAAGDVLITIEAMKMEHEVRSAQTGVVSEVLVSVGDQVEASQVVAVVGAPSAPEGSAD